MNYFQDFGGIEKIETFMEAINALHDKSQFKKDKLPENYADIIKKYSEETDKMYRKFDCEAALNEIWDSIPDKKTSVVKLIKYQNELFGYVSYQNPKLKDMGLVLSVDVKYSPKIEIHMLDTGETKTFKLQKNAYTKNPFDTNAIIQFHYEERPRSKMVNGKWEKLQETEPWIVNYIIKKDL
jgi:hypothetical protein